MTMVNSIMTALLYVMCIVSLHAQLESAEFLEELPLTSLLVKKRSVILELSRCENDTLMSSGSCISTEYRTESDPVASALVRPLQHMQVRGGPHDRGHFEVEHQEEEEDDDEYDWMPMPKGGGKVGKIFDSSVTALAFLAFGGYLICLICSVFKDKQSATSTTASDLYQQLLTQAHMKPTSHYGPGLTLRPSGRKRRRRRDIRNHSNHPDTRQLLLSEKGVHDIMVHLVNRLFENHNYNG